MTPRILAQMYANLTAVKPTVATFISGVTIFADAAVWQEQIKGWAGTITILLGAPTALCLLAYWILKTRDLARAQFPHWFAK